MKTLAVSPLLENTASVTAFVEEVLETHGCSPKVVFQMSLAVDELFSNIARYSAATEATVACGVADGTATLCFTDNGQPYDPTQKDDPDTSLSAEEREVGGLGIYLVRKTMDSFTYEYRDGCNVLTVTKKL